MMKDYSYSLFIITLSFFSLTQIRVRLLPNNMGVTEMPMTTCTTLYHMYCVAEPKITTALPMEITPPTNSIISDETQTP